MYLTLFSNGIMPLYPIRTFPENPDAAISDKLFRSVLNRALQQLHGIVGGAVPLEVLGPKSLPDKSERGGVVTPVGNQPGASALMVVKMDKM